MNNKTKYTQLIKTEAKRLGFLSCGVSKAQFLEEEAPRLEKWLNNNMHGQMSYMQNHFDKRLDPTKLVEDSKSVVSLLLNYYPDQTQTEDSYKLSKYAYGTDYHFVIKDKLKQLLAYINQEIGEVYGRAFVDSAPVLDKAWAAKSGLGWIGKHSNLLSQKTGSFYFIAELIIDLELDYDNPTTDHCGTCTACIDACPTQAIVEPYVVDGSKCISYFTIE
ncbi:MAG: tRNA epoxyqueuosine(34) reductase QueG, partial [Flavobacteriaceae bacterium]|nr:tRNA epoxyqueuosine(34) reductase QueG [Flavobacteriaceae bacterium]